MSKKIWILGLIATTGAAQATVLDAFTDAQAFCVQQAGGTTFVDTALGLNVIGGQRDVQVTESANPFNQKLDVTFGGGLSVVSSGFGVKSDITLQYDRIDEFGNTGANKVLQNGGTGAPLLSGSNDRVRVNFVGNDLKVAMLVTARKNGAVIGTGTGIRTAGQGAGFVDIAMNQAAMAQADSISIAFTPDTSGDFALSSIEAVPEPATLAALALVGLAARRRRK